MPSSSLAGTVDPNTDCPKKKKSLQEDTVNIYESENKILEDIQLQQVPAKKPIPEKVAQNASYNSADESDKVEEGDPNSAMTFNFIYYIIDKFKFTDPLE